MNIACVIREQRRWGLNGLLTRPLNTCSTMKRNRGEKAEKERKAPNTDRRELRAREGGRKLEDGKEISESKGQRK